VLRIYLTAEDLLTIRFASQPAPLLEVGLAVAAFQGRDPVFRRWCRSAARHLPAAAGPLWELIPASATGPLFLEPVTADLTEGLEFVQEVPAAAAAAELQRVSGHRSPGPWVKRLAARDRDAWHELGEAQRAMHQFLAVTAWERILFGFRAQLAWCSRLIAEQGVRAALSTVHPHLTWDGAVMQIEGATTMNLYPNGANLILLPSALWTGRPLITVDPRTANSPLDIAGPGTPTVTLTAGSSLVIIYPASAPLPLIDISATNPLAGLLGHTRAAVLQLTTTDQTTTELARTLNISAATISAHTKALRGAGLITTTRTGKSVLHALTPLGEKLLASATGTTHRNPRRHRQ
jgi:DNA-binding transcriptional ArsR family regulator